MSSSPDRLSFDQVYAKVLEETVSGRYRPGDRIAAAELAHRVAVSATPVREALSRLVGRGLLEQRRSEGYYLARLDARDITDLYNLHEYCVMSALPSADLPISPPLKRDPDPWPFFDRITSAAGNAVIHTVRRYVDDRLKPLRSIETSLLRASPSGTAPLFRKQLSHDQLRLIIKEFHDRRRAIAPDTSIHFGRSKNKQNI